MQASLPRVPETDVASFVGAAALGRARGYADATRIRELRYDVATHRLDADVAGSGGRGGRAWYSTTVHLTAPDADVEPPAGLLECTVQLRAHGDEHRATVTVDGGVLRWDGAPTTTRVGDRIELVVDPSRVHLFDAGTGVAVGHPE